MKAIFLDRDGTIIHDGGYLYKPTEIKYFSDTFDVLKKLQNLGYALFMVTNQSGVAKKMFCEADIIKVYNKIQSDLKAQGIKPFVEMAYCPHGPEDDCACRKPKSKMIDDLVAKWKIDKKNSVMVGDKLIDAECGKNAGIHGVVLGQDSKDYPSVKNLTEFYEWLKKHLG
ncbi:MAG: HAD family hydrolase [Bacteriovoracaceae bacterium]|nr:HAD family hydrolase [Bacteriovoracaceae bacterium]